MLNHKKLHVIVRPSVEPIIQQCISLIWTIVEHHCGKGNVSLSPLRGDYGHLMEVDNLQPMDHNFHEPNLDR